MAFESLSNKLQDVFKQLRGKGKLTEKDVKTAMREVKLALLEADVNFKIVKDFVNNEAEAYKKIYEEYDGNLEVITDEQYRSLIRNKRSKEFYMLSINR